MPRLSVPPANGERSCFNEEMCKAPGVAMEGQRVRLVPVQLEEEGLHGSPALLVSGGTCGR